MKKIGYLIFASLMFSIVALFNSLQLTADAATINFSALKSGTSDTSYADAYMVKPAQLDIVNNKYQVTYTIKTQKALGKYPVQVKSMNVNTTGIKNYEDAGNYYSAITFESDQLSNITGTMTINVDSYNIHATHTFTLKFLDTPSLSSGNSASTAASSDNSGQNVQAADSGKTDNNANDGNSAENSTDNSSADNGERAVTIGKPQKISNGSKKKAPVKKSDSKTKAIEKKDKKNKVNNINIPKITAVTTVVALVAGGGYFATKKFF
ncbi:NEAT domain-containing protein [Companilactobacillus jidongensis]|uniref:NEAT domain-containing protein n=1 Tax=Companilactobacillus jidongensis TaxID=2486006 RepID=UPI000F7966EF|nr:NEAT domain-containing protein [Companilactobacillus jidongensis]